MSQQLKTVAKIKFEGDRFEGHALDRDSLLELAQYLDIVKETAEYLWRTNHKGRIRLPKGFEQGLEIKVTDIQNGSAQPVLKSPLMGNELIEAQPHYFVVQAVAESYGIYDAISKKKSLPKDFPVGLLSAYTKLGSSLNSHESIGILPYRKRKAAKITKDTQAYSLTLLGTEFSRPVNISGIVQEINAKQNQFQIWPDDRSSVTVSYTSEQEKEIIKALEERDLRKIHVSGTGEYNKQGTLLRIVEINQLVPIAPTRPRPQFGSAKGKVKMEHDFNAPLTEFKDYM